MSLRKALRWTLPPVALVAIVGWLLSSAAPRADAETAAASPQSAGMVPVQGPAAQPPSAAGPDRSAFVRKFVDQKNKESERARFVAAGWEIVKTDPPDAKLVALDPSLLHGREQDLRAQIASTSASPAQAA